MIGQAKKIKMLQLNRFKSLIPIYLMTWTCVVLGVNIDPDTKLPVTVIPEDALPFHQCHCASDKVRELMNYRLYSCKRCYWTGLNRWDQRFVFNDPNPVNSIWYTPEACELGFRERNLTLETSGQRSGTEPVGYYEQFFKEANFTESRKVKLTAEIFYCPSQDHPDNHMEDCICMCNPFPINWAENSSGPIFSDIRKVAPVMCFHDPCHNLKLDKDNPENSEINQTLICGDPKRQTCNSTIPKKPHWIFNKPRAYPPKAHCTYCTNDSACENGGKCPDPLAAINWPRNYIRECECPNPEFIGHTCEHENHCFKGGDAACGANGRCVNIEDGSAYTCQCNQYSRGDRCQLKRLCDSSTCLNAMDRKNCQEIGDIPGTEDFDCGTCKTGFSGSKCDQEDECESKSFKQCSGCEKCCKTNPIKDVHGVIQKRFTACDCTQNVPPSHGYQCQYADKCTSTTCGGPDHGICIEDPTDGESTCQCKHGFSGSHCTIEDFCITTYVNACHKQHGRCNSAKSTASAVFCDCEPEYGPSTTCNDLECNSWTRCELSHGTVVKDVVKGSCSCKCDGKKYKQSPTSAKECVEDKCFQHCSNGGQCNEGPGGRLSCDCSQINYSGEQCDILDKCKEEPGICGNGDCTFDLTGLDGPQRHAYICTCQTGWYNHTTENCAYFNPCIAELATEPHIQTKLCKNSGICNHVQDQKDGFTCDCLTEEGWEGSDCTIRNTCISDLYKEQPCQNGGSCVHTGGDELEYKCICNDQRFHGQHCEFTNACVVDNECQNGAPCVPVGNDFNCVCGPGFDGKLCDEENICVTKSSTIQCRKRGECKRKSNMDYECQCDPQAPFRGHYCHVLNRCLVSSDKCYYDVQPDGITKTPYCYPCINGMCIAEDFDRLVTDDSDNTVKEGSYGCNCTGTNYIGELCEIRKTDVSVEFPAEVVENSATPFRIVLNSRGDEPFELDVDLGDDFKFTLTTDNFQATGSGTFVYEFIQRYLTNGPVTAQISWKNKYKDAGQLTIEINVVKSNECLPIKVNLLNCGPSPLEDVQPALPRYKRKALFVISAAFDYLPCPGIKTSDLEEKLQFVWQLYQLTPAFPVPSQANQWNLETVTENFNERKKFVTFPPFKINAGLYWIGVDVGLENLENANKVSLTTFDRCFFKVENEAPFVYIEGGTDRTVQLGNVLTIDANAVDLGEPANHDFLEYNWWYTRPGYPDTNCVEFSSNCDGPTLVVDPETHQLDITSTDSFYTFSLQVRSDYSKLTSAIVEQRIHVREKGLPIAAECVRNCDRWNLDDRILIQCSCPGCDVSNLDYSLFHTQGTNDPVQVQAASSNSGEFVVELGSTGKHLLVCHGENADAFKGDSTLELIVNSPPSTTSTTGGCTVNLNDLDTQLDVLSGIFLVDEFSIQCADFTTTKQAEPLTYLTYAKIRGFDIEHLPHGILLFHDVKPVVENLQIPSGVSRFDFEVEILIKVVDALGGFAWIKPIKGKINPPREDNVLHIVNNYLDESPETENNNVMRRIKAGDDQGALQILLGILYSKVGLETEDPTVDKVEWDEHRQELLLAIGHLLKKIQLSSSLAIQHVSHGHYLLCSHYVDENTKLELLEICKDLQQSIGSALQQTVELDQEVLPTEDIEIMARGLKEAGGKVIREVSERGMKILKDAKSKPATTSTTTDGNKPTPPPTVVQLSHEEILGLDEVDRDYFSDPYFEDEIDKTNASTFIEVNDFNLWSREIEQLAAIGQEIFGQMQRVMDAVAEREVNRFDFEGKKSTSSVRATVHVIKADDITKHNFGNSDGDVTIKISGGDLTKYLDDQEINDVFVEIVSSDSNPFFGDVDYPIDTTVTSVVLKDGESGNPIGVTENTTIDVFIPWKKAGTRREVVTVTAPLVTAAEIDPYENIQVYVLYLPPGSQLQVYIDPDPLFPDLLFMVVAIPDVHPTQEDFCVDTKATELDDRGNSQIINPSGIYSASNPRTFAHFYIDDFQSDADEIDMSKFNRFTYYVGIWPHEHEHIAQLGSLTPFGTNVTYNVSFTQTSCLMRDENKNDWDDTKCVIGNGTNAEVLHCRCKHMSIFAGSIFIPPNSIDFIQDIQIVLGVDHIPIVISTLGAILFIYICLLILCYIFDRRDKTHHVGLVIMTRIGEDYERSFYLINVVTGSRLLAGTSANVSIQLYGANGRSETYVIKDPTLPVLNRGGNDSFLVSSKNELGNLEKIRIWHDNTGHAPGWYLRRVVVQDVKTGEKWYFFIETWLSLTYEDNPSINREIPVAGPNEQRKWSRVFQERLVDELNNTHIWFSIFLRYPTSHFTRCQRLTCAMAIATSYMLINIMFFGIPTTDIESQIEFGIFTINVLSIWLSLETALLALPFGVVLVHLFQRIRQRYIPTLIIWKNRTKVKLDYDEARFFVPDDSGIVKEIFQASPFSADSLPETRHQFIRPGTNISKCEKYVLDEAKGADWRDQDPSHLLPNSQLFRAVDREGNTVSHSERNVSNNPQINAFGLYTVMDYVRRRVNAFSFFYAGDNSNKRIEELVEAEIPRYAAEMANIKKEDLDRVKDEMKNRKGGMPSVEPVQLVERLMLSDNDNSDDEEHGTGTGSTEPQKFGIALELCEMPPMEKVCCYLPWWFVYIAWSICVIVILICSIITMIYGLRYGRLVSIQWTSGVLLSWAQSLFVVQPFTIFLLALLFSVFKETTVIEEERFQVLFKEDGEYIGNQKPLRLRTFHPLQEYPPLSSAEIFQLRIKARRTNTLKRSAISIFFHILLIIFLCIIANSNHSRDDYYLTSHMQRMLQVSEFESCPECVKDMSVVHDEESFYWYVRKIFLPAINPIERYDGKRLPPLGSNDPTTMRDETTLLIGVPRIRQLRMRPRECKLPRNLKILIAGNSSVGGTAEPGSLETFDCIRNYETEYGDTQTYNPYWMPVVQSRTFKSANDIWKYRPENETLSRGRKGLLGYYDGGGYIAELGKDYRRSHSVIGYMQQTKWIDHRTRGIIIEFVVFNPNLNLFADVAVVFERSPSTAFRARSSVTPLRLSNTNLDESYARLLTASYVCVAILMCILSYLFINDLAYHWKHHRFHLFSNFWLWADMIIIITCTSSLIIALHTVVLFNEVNKRLQIALINEYVSFQEVALWNFIRTTMFALSLCLCLIKFWKLLVLSFKRFYIMSLTLKLTSRFLFALLFLLGIFLIAFAMLGNVIFGATILKFHSFSHAFLELIDQLLAVNFYQELYQTHSILGPLFFFIFGFTVCCIGLNIFIALLNQGFMEAKEVAAQKRHWLTYWSFLRDWYLSKMCSNTYTSSSSRQKSQNQRDQFNIPQSRLNRMKKVTIDYMNSYLQREQVVRMNQMRAIANDWLRDTEYHIVSKSAKWRRIRNKMNTSHVGEDRMNQMRAAAALYIKKKKRLYFTGEEYRKIPVVDLNILKLKCTKVEQITQATLRDFTELDKYVMADQEEHQNYKMQKEQATMEEIEVTPSAHHKRSVVEEEFEKRRRISILGLE